MNISVGICTRNRWQVLEKVLLSLSDQTFPADQFEVVLVDDGSTDETAAMAQRLKSELPYRLVYCYQTHSALATARNTGIRASSGQVILYIDDDVLAETDLLAEHWKMHQAHDRCVVNGWVNHVTEPVRPPRPKFTMADISTSFFWTSNVSVKRAHLIEAGLFDEDFKEYGWEDQELGLRLMAIGLKKQNNYKAIGYHVKRPPTRANIPGALGQARAKARTARLYIRKHPRLRSRFSTGLHHPRLAWAAMSNFGRLFERYLRNTLGVDWDDQLFDSEDRPLNSHEAWCLRELSTVVYFQVLRKGRAAGAAKEKQ